MPVQDPDGILVAARKTQTERRCLARGDWLDGGVIVEAGKPRDVLASPSHERTKVFLYKVP
jgi:ABC-type polar amino acid transport system ATPase subunit